MSTQQSQSLFESLKRRDVFRVSLAYAGVAWLLLQVADVLFPILGLPDWTVRVVAIACLLGFPIAVVLAWLYKVTPEGIRPDDAGAEAVQHGRVADYTIIAILTVAVAWFAVDKFFWRDVRGPTVDEPTLAVLPFATIGGDPAQEYFADGLTEELLNMLARVDQLRVIGRTSAFQFKDHSEDLREIGRRLGAHYLLEGSVRKDGEHVRVIAHLVEAESGVRLWSDTFDTSLVDVIGVQLQIARAVAAQLRIEFIGLAAQPVDGAAFDAYLQGLRLSRIPGPANTQQAIAVLERAVEQDPSLARAWAQLGRTYATAVGQGALAPTEGIAKARHAVASALAADPALADAYYVLGNLELSFELDFDAASAAYQHALVLAPDHAGALRGAASLAAARGDFNAALDYLARSASIDPLSLATLHNEAYFRYLQGEYETAETLFRKALAFAGESYGLGRSMLALTLLGQGKPAEALAETRNEKAEPFRLASQSLVYHALGMDQEAQASLMALIDRYGDRLAIPIAGSYAQRGQFDEAFAWLERAYAQQDGQLLWLGVHPVNEPLHSDPRFAALLRRLGLE